MNDQEIHTVLHEISDRAQAEQVDVWPALARQLPARKRPLRLAHALGALLLLLALSAVTYFALQIDVDPGLQGERAVALVTPLDQRQAQGETTATLDWAYADPNRLVLAYTVTVPEAAALPQPEEPVSLLTTWGQALPQLMLVHQASPGPGILNKIVSFDTRELGNAIGTEAPDVDFTAVIHTGSDEPFVFPFAVPMYPSQLDPDQQSVAAAGITMRLEDFRITNSMTTVELCYDRPETEAIWTPQLQLFFDGIRVGSEPGSGYFAEAPRQEEDIVCYGGGWFLPVDVRPEQVRLEIPYLTTPTYWTYENMETLAAVWAEYGVETEIRDGGATYTLSYPQGFPEGMTAATREAIVEEALGRMEDVDGGERITGPWVFTMP